jgi:hypothetical protein
MELGATTALYPLHRCKTIYLVLPTSPFILNCTTGKGGIQPKKKTIGSLHLPYVQVRHAQGIHNVAGEKDFGAYMSHELFDAQLTPLGWNQVRFCSFFFFSHNLTSPHALEK